MSTDSILLVTAIVLAFYMAWNMGANDVANAMGTSVGSGALTLRKALLLAAVLEFCGAFFVGSEVSQTIESGIVNTQLFVDDPRQLVFGMLASLLAAGVWLQVASYYGLPVSTTHSIVGALIGFGLVAKGPGSIQWGEFGKIVLSWVLSPLLGGVFAYLIFSFVRKRILYKKDPMTHALRFAPWMVFAVFFMLSLVILFDGLSHLHLNLNFTRAFGLSILIGAVCTLIATFFLRRQGKRLFAKYQHSSIAVESLFIFLQTLSAGCMAFSHGANDVANAIGPLASIVRIIKTGAVPLQEQVPTWILMLGGAGIVIGLATWGWRVIDTIGKKITELTPTRGFSAEFGAAITILVASKLGLPISTTHTLVGAVLGVGLARGIDALNLHMIRDIIVSWVVTVPIGAILAIAFYYGFSAIF
ncbi:MAG: inorganic phosphate transporter [Parachlamydiales bacterium]|nr:inorganic phosphate transporter [Parachlamydiales bacterium]